MEWTADARRARAQHCQAEYLGRHLLVAGAYMNGFLVFQSSDLFVHAAARRTEHAAAPALSPTALAEAEARARAAEALAVSALNHKWRADDDFA